MRIIHTTEACIGDLVSREQTIIELPDPVRHTLTVGIEIDEDSFARAKEAIEELRRAAE